MHASKEWGKLSNEEQQEKIKTIAELLKNKGLDKVKVSAQEHIVCPLKSGAVQKQAFLNVEGSVNKEQESLAKEATHDIKKILEGVTPQTAQVEIAAKLAVGAPYVEITGVVDVWKKEEVNIPHKSGQVMLIDFWATWCPPCQAPMAHNQEMLAHHGERWGDKVRIIGISIDQTVEAVTKHVKAKGWEKVEHFHRAGSSADEDYGVQGVPHVVLIDGHGKIAYVGHPASRDLEKDIETLIKGEPLKGVESGDDDDQEDGGFEAKDASAVTAELSRYEDDLKNKLLTNSAVQAAAKQMMRDFVVIVKEVKYDTGKQAFMTKVENINVLVGPKQSLDALKTEIEGFFANFKGSFKSNYRVQAM